MKYIFPFWRFPKDSRVVLYAAGNVGKDYYVFSSFYEWVSVLCWVDENVKEACGIPVCSPDEIRDLKEYDYVLIALQNEETSEEVRDFLSETVGIPVTRIIWENPDISFSLQKFFDWYYDNVFSISTKKEVQKYALKCQFKGFPVEMISETIDLLPECRFACADEDADKAMACFYGLECGRTNCYPDVSNSSVVKVGFWYGEADIPNMNFLDYAFTSRRINNDRCYYVNYFFPEDFDFANRGILIDHKDKYWWTRRRFCNFIYSNETHGEGAKKRKDFCKRLQSYKRVDCPGRVLNNMTNVIAPREGMWAESKRSFIGEYKFTIAFENTKAPGYTTEKLWDALRMCSIPIYWGNPEIGEYINKDCFINCNDFDDDYDAIIDRVTQIDNDDELYMYMLRLSPLENNAIWEWKDSFRNVFDDMIAGNHLKTDLEDV